MKKLTVEEEAILHPQPMLILTPSAFPPAVPVQAVGGTWGLGSHSPWGSHRLNPTTDSSEGSFPAAPNLSLLPLSGGKASSSARQMGSWGGVCVFLPKHSAVSPPWSLHTIPLCLLEKFRCHTFGCLWIACVCSPLT